MKTLALLLFALLLMGCDKPEPVDIIQPQRQAMEKAKEVEQVLQKNAEETRKRIDEAEHP